jgi:hypothetical protein
VIESMPQDPKDWPVDIVYASLSDAYLLAGEIERAASVVEEGLRRAGDSQDLHSVKVIIHLVHGQIDAALEEAGAVSDDSDRLFLRSMLLLLAAKGDSESSARRFLGTDHVNRGYIRMMLSWSLRRTERDREAKELLDDGWNGIDRSTWPERLEGGDPLVLGEMLIGYYAGEVGRDQIFGPLEDSGTFEQSSLRHLGLPLSALRCEVYFYDALLQGVSGDAETRRERQIDRLEKVIASQYTNYNEYYMAHYLLGQLKAEQH